MTEKELLEKVSLTLQDLNQNGISPSGMQTLENKIDRLQDDTNDLKLEVKEIKAKLLDPETGQIVKTNKNSSFRRRWEQKSEAIEETLDDIYGKLESIESWKHTVTRILWIVFTAIAGIAAKMVFGDVFTL
jgi:predicted  nucleic acid-binding Zn-ribbon protein